MKPGGVLLNNTNSIIFVSCSRDFLGCCSTPKYWNSYVPKNGFTRQSPPITSNHLPITSKNHHQSPSNHLVGPDADTANLVCLGANRLRVKVIQIPEC